MRIVLVVVSLVALLFLPAGTRATASHASLVGIDMHGGTSSVETTIDVARGIDTGARAGNAPFHIELSLTYAEGSHHIARALRDTSIIGPGNPAPGPTVRIRIVTEYPVHTNGSIFWHLFIIEDLSDQPVSESSGVCEVEHVSADVWKCIPYNRRRP